MGWASIASNKFAVEACLLPIKDSREPGRNCCSSWRHGLLFYRASMVMDPTYIRPLPTKETMRLIYLQEFGCFLWCVGIAVVPPVFLGRWPIPFLLHAYLMSICIVMLNSVRTLGSHRCHGGGKSMSFVDQLRDSVNYPHYGWISELWGPVGTRFHALHHLFPSLPYHAMPQAHRRLMDALPSDSPYREAQENSLTVGVVRLWHAASGRGKSPKSVIRSELYESSTSGQRK
jgi:fatty acid desaturase